MTPEERAKAALDSVDIGRALAWPILRAIADAIRAAVDEERETCARLVEDREACARLVGRGAGAAHVGWFSRYFAEVIRSPSIARPVSPESPPGEG